MSNDNLPPDTKPGDSDPPKPPVWTGLVHGNVNVHGTVFIRKRDACVDEDDAMELARERLLGGTRHRNPGLDCEVGDFIAEPD